MVNVALILLPGFQAMSFAPLSVFEVANSVSGESVYQVAVQSETGGRIPNSFGMQIDTGRVGDSEMDTLVVGAGPTVTPASAGLIAYLREALPVVRRMASICIGAFTLAQAGLLDGRRATTHWAYARDLQQAYPKIRVEMDRIFIADGKVWTSAGMTAGIDMALGLVENDLGREVAHRVAQTLVLHHRRAGGQSQHSALLALDARSDRVQHALDFARRNLRQPLPVAELADAAHLSVRQFSRLFRDETGLSPAQAVARIRLDAAQLMLEQGRLPIEVIAQETGFGDRERMRRAFLRLAGRTPRAIRNDAGPLASM